MRNNFRRIGAIRNDIFGAPRYKLGPLYTESTISLKRFCSSIEFNSSKMNFALACFVLLAVFSLTEGQKKITSTAAIIKPSPTTVGTSHPTITPSTSSINPSSSSISASTSFPPINNSSAINPNTTMNPNMSTTTHPNNTVNPNMSSTVYHNASSPVPSTAAKSTQTPAHSSTPHPTKSAGKDDKDYDDVKKRMWVAASFAIILGITTVLLAILVYRQRKINRELSGDPAASRLL